MVKIIVSIYKVIAKLKQCKLITFLDHSVDTDWSDVAVRLPLMMYLNSCIIAGLNGTERTVDRGSLFLNEARHCPQFPSKFYFYPSASCDALTVNSIISYRVARNILELGQHNANFCSVEFASETCEIFDSLCLLAASDGRQKYTDSSSFVTHTNWNQPQFWSLQTLWDVSPSMELTTSLPLGIHSLRLQSLWRLLVNESKITYLPT